MSLEINVPDKILSGLNQSYTMTTDEPVAPTGSVTVNGLEVPHRVIPLGPPKEQTANDVPTMKYKVSFLLPGDSAGQKLELHFAAAASKADESFEIASE